MKKTIIASIFSCIAFLGSSTLTSAAPLGHHTTMDMPIADPNSPNCPKIMDMPIADPNSPNCPKVMDMPIADPNSRNCPKIMDMPIADPNSRNCPKAW